MALVLIVDDDPDMAELLGHMLDILGLEHRYVATGEEALAECLSYRPDIIVLDVMLEKTDGWAVYAKLVEVTDKPIIFITAWRTGENRQRANALLADGFLAKPISYDDFARSITSVLGQRARRLNTAATA